MAEGKYFKCGVCGALMEKETGDTFFKKGSNAESMEELKADNSKLKADLLKISEAYNELSGKKDEVDNGGDGTETDSDNPGKQKSGNNDEEFWEDGDDGGGGGDPSGD